LSFLTLAKIDVSGFTGGADSPSVLPFLEKTGKFINRFGELERTEAKRNLLDDEVRLLKQDNDDITKEFRKIWMLLNQASVPAQDNSGAKMSISDRVHYVIAQLTEATIDAQ
jgi:hypothetical protein